MKKLICIYIVIFCTLFVLAAKLVVNPNDMQDKFKRYVSWWNNKTSWKHL